MSFSTPSTLVSSMCTVVFNRIPKRPTPFPLFEFDCSIDIKDLKISCSVNDNPTFRSVLLEIDHLGHKYPMGEIKLYHSGNVFNYERTFDSAHFLALEIVRRFNSFCEKGQQCFEL